jgi:hypothetical protein
MAGAVHSERAARKNVGSIPAENGLCDFAGFRLAGTGRTSALGLIRSVPLAHLSGFVYVARLPSAPFPLGTLGWAIFLPVLR